MARTCIRGDQITDGTVQRQDLDVQTAGAAVVAKIVAGTNVTLSSTGPDAGTGDVTVNVSLPGGSTDPNALHLSGGTMTGTVRLSGGAALLGADYGSRLQRLTVMPAGYAEQAPLNFRFDQDALRFVNRIGTATINAPNFTSNEIDWVFSNYAQCFNLSGKPNPCSIEITGLNVGSCMPGYMYPFVVTHSPWSNQVGVKMELANVETPTTWAVAYDGPVNVYKVAEYVRTGSNGIAGVRWTFSNLKNPGAATFDFNAYCRWLGLQNVADNAYKWNVMRGGDTMYGNLVVAPAYYVSGNHYGPVATNVVNPQSGSTVTVNGNVVAAPAYYLSGLHQGPVKTDSINPQTTGATIGLSGTLAPWTLEWNTARSVFGQSTHRINELSNVFWQADKRFPTTGGSKWIFDGGFDSCYQLPSGVTVIDIPVAGYGGMPSYGITYPQGSIYVSFYNTAYAYDSISMQVSGKTAGWVDLGTPTNVSNNANFKVLKFAVPGSFQYAKEYKLTVSVPSGALCWMTELSYVLSRWTADAELPYVDKHQSLNTLFGTLSVNDNSGQRNSALVGTAHSYLNVLSGNVGIGTSAPAYKLDVSGNSRFTSNATFASNVTFGDKSGNLWLDVYRKDDTVNNQIRFYDGSSCCWAVGQASGGTSGLYIQRVGLSSVTSWGFADGKLTHYKGALFNSGLEVSAPGSGKALTINGNAGNPYTWVYVEGVDTGNNMTILDLNAGNGVYGTRLMTHGLHTYLTAYTTAAGADLCFNVGTGNNGHGTNYMTLTSGGQLSLHGNMVADSGISGRTLTSTVAAGTAPLAVSSNTLVANLNADLLDGNEASAFAAASHNHDATYLKLGGGTLTGALTCNSTVNVNSPFSATYSSTWCPTATFAHASTATDAMWSSAAPVAAFQNTSATSGNFTYFAFNDANGYVNGMLGCKHVDHSAHTGILQLANHGSDGAYVRTQLELDGTLHQLYGLQVDGAASVAGDLAASGNISMSASKRIKGWTQSRTLNVESPGAAENLTFFYTRKALTLTDCVAVLVGGTSPSVTFQISYGSTRSAAGTNFWSSSQVCNSTGSGTDHSSFSNSSIPAGSWIWFKTSVSNGSPSQISVFLEYAEA